MLAPVPYLFFPVPFVSSLAHSCTENSHDGSVSPATSHAREPLFDLNAAQILGVIIKPVH